MAFERRPICQLDRVGMRDQIGRASQDWGLRIYGTPFRLASYTSRNTTSSRTEPQHGVDRSLTDDQQADVFSYHNRS